MSLKPGRTWGTPNVPPTPEQRRGPPPPQSHPRAGARAARPGPLRPARLYGHRAASLWPAVEDRAVTSVRWCCRCEGETIPPARRRSGRSSMADERCVSARLYGGAALWPALSGAGGAARGRGRHGRHGRRGAGPGGGAVRAVLRGAGRGGLGPLRAPDLLPLLRADAGALRRPVLRRVPGGAAAGEAGPGAAGASRRAGQRWGTGRTGKVLGGTGRARGIRPLPRSRGCRRRLGEWETKCEENGV